MGSPVCLLQSLLNLSRYKTNNLLVAYNMIDGRVNSAALISVNIMISGGVFFLRL